MFAVLFVVATVLWSPTLTAGVSCNESTLPCIYITALTPRSLQLAVVEESTFCRFGIFVGKWLLPWCDLRR